MQGPGWRQRARIASRRPASARAAGAPVPHDGLGGGGEHDCPQPRTLPGTARVGARDPGPPVRGLDLVTPAIVPRLAHAGLALHGAFQRIPACQPSGPASPARPVSPAPPGRRSSSKMGSTPASLPMISPLYAEPPAVQRVAERAERVPRLHAPPRVVVMPRPFRSSAIESAVSPVAEQQPPGCAGSPRPPPPDGRRAAHEYGTRLAVLHISSQSSSSWTGTRSRTAAPTRRPR